jgi:hypothetical protein
MESDGKEMNLIVGVGHGPARNVWRSQVVRTSTTKPWDLRMNATQPQTDLNSGRADAAVVVDSKLQHET